MATYDPAKESVKEIVSQVPGVDITGTKIDSGAGDVSGFTPTGRGGRGGGRGTPTTPYEVEPGETPVTVELIPSIPSAPPPAPKTISAQMEEVETIKGEEYTRGQLIELGMEGDLKRMGGETQYQYEARLVGYGKGIAYGYPTQAQTFVTGGVTISRGVEEDLLYKKEELLEKAEEEHGQILVEKNPKIRTRRERRFKQKRLNEILALAMQRYSGSQASEITSTSVTLPNDDLKGRIIGKEGRNIKTLEKLTGVEILVDDTPGAIVISGFDPIRRQIAKIALEKTNG